MKSMFINKNTNWIVITNNQIVQLNDKELLNYLPEYIQVYNEELLQNVNMLSCNLIEKAEETGCEIFYLNNVKCYLIRRKDD